MFIELKRYLTLILFLIFSVSYTVYAANHIIKFGGTLGSNYDPSNFSVSVGDTVTWQGSFSSHPLSSTSVPEGSETFSKNSGDSFSYIVQIAGTYNYKCDFHAANGMLGSFTAIVSSIEAGVLSDLPAVFDLKQNYPNPFNPSTTIEFSLSAAEFVNVNIYNHLGQEIITLVSKKLAPGNYTYTWDADNIASGVYVCRVQAGGNVRTIKMILLR